MATKRPKAKTHRAILKSNIRKVAKTNAADLNEVAARLMMQSERNIVTQAAALLIRKTS
jgi:hypothetical protein